MTKKLQGHPPQQQQTQSAPSESVYQTSLGQDIGGWIPSKEDEPPKRNFDTLSVDQVKKLADKLPEGDAKTRLLETIASGDLPKRLDSPITPAKRKPLVLIDMDGVVFNYIKGFLREWLQRYPDEMVIWPDQQTEFYFEDLYPKHLHERIHNIVRGKGFFFDLPLMEGVVPHLMAMLNDSEIDYMICSSPDTDCVDYCGHSEKAASLQEHFGTRWAKKLILTRDKTVVAGDYLIDDKPNIKGLKSPYPWKQVVFSAAYNKDMNAQFRMDSWADWPDVRKQILEDWNNNDATKSTS